MLESINSSDTAVIFIGDGRLSITGFCTATWTEIASAVV